MEKTGNTSRKAMLAPVNQRYIFYCYYLFVLFKKHSFITFNDQKMNVLLILWLFLKIENF